MAVVAHMLHTPIGELMEMELDELLAWHRECELIAKHYNKGSG